MAETAGLAGAARVLEIGCGTGQLTRQLAQLPIQLTAIDLGPAMVGRARAEVRDPAVRFEAYSFEDFEAAPRSFDLIVCGTAFHWLDPEVAWSKPADLLASGGWLAIGLAQHRPPAEWLLASFYAGSYGRRRPVLTRLRSDLCQPVPQHGDLVR